MVKKLVLLFILLAPLLNGLFFKEDLYAAAIFLLIIFIAMVIKNKQIISDIRIIALFTVQIILCSVSVFTGINKEEAVYGLFIWIAPILIYCILINIGNPKFTQQTISAGQQSSTGDRKLSINNYRLSDVDLQPIAGHQLSDSALQSIFYNVYLMIFSSGFIVSVINIIIAFGSAGLNQSTKQIIKFTWVIPYSNTLALYSFICIIAGLYLLGKSRTGIYKRVFIEYSLLLDMISIVFAFSRYMWIIAFFLICIYLFSVRHKSLFSDCLCIIVTALPCVIVLFLMPAKTYWLILILTPLIFFFYEKKIFALPKKSAVIALPTLAGLFVLFIVFVGGSSIYSKLIDFYTNLNIQTLQERMAYYWDALKIIRDHPVFGVGPGGWSSIQYKYQTALYSTKYIHSSVFQAALDYGIPGLLIFILPFFVSGVYVYIYIKKNKEKEMFHEVVCLTLINAAILFHSLLDFDFEFPLISILFWINFALLSRITGYGLRSAHLSTVASGTIFAVAAFAAIPAAAGFISAILYTGGISNYNSQNYDKALTDFEKASFYCPFSSNIYYMKGRSLINKFESYGGKGLLEAAELSIIKAEKYDVNNPRYEQEKANIAKYTVDFTGSVKAYRDLMILRPLAIEYYEAYAEAIIKKYENDMESGINFPEKSELTDVINIEKGINKTMSGLSKLAYRLKHKPELTLTPKLAYNIGKAYFYLTKYDEAKKYLEIASSDVSLIESVNQIKSRFKK